jgi:glutathione synthase/RimK-type ligase-like ATP-grasp enzyme
MDSLKGYVSDDDLAIEPLNQLGWQVETISWRDVKVDWNAFEAVVIRTTWDYQKSPNEFIRTLQKIDASRARLANPLKIIRWNLSKLYLRELGKNGIKIVPTIWSENRIDRARFQKWLDYFQTDELVIKPIVSATAEFTYRLRNFTSELSEIFINKPFMVQPLMPQIISEGEFSLFYFGGNYSHAILKTPQEGDFRVQEEHGGLISAIVPTAKLRQAAQKVFDLIRPVPLYARIDFVRSSEDDFCLMELELIEPALYFRMDKKSAGRFAKAVDRWLKN